MSFSQPIADIVRARFSCRTYAGRPIERNARRRLVELAAAHTTGPFGTRPRFALLAATDEDNQALRGLGTYGLIKGATGFLVGVSREEGKALEDFGYLMEQLVLYATDLGLGTCWLGGTFTRRRFAEKVSLGTDETIPCVVSVGYIAKRPRALDAVMRLGAGSHTRHPWSRLFFEQAFAAPLSRDAAGAYAVPLEMVRLGPSASNKQPWRIVRAGNVWHFYMWRTRGYREGSRLNPFPSADLQRIDMGIAMCHFALTARELGLEGQWSFDEPAIDEPSDLIEYAASWVG